MVGQCPDQMELPFALWSSTAIRALIHSLWGIKMGQRTISDYMRRWGYTPQKAAKRAYERSDKATQEWLNDIYPAIKQRATQCDAEIFWGDETGISNQCQHVRGYAPRGQTPVIKTQSKRLRSNLISAVNLSGFNSPQLAAICFKGERSEGKNRVIPRQLAAGIAIFSLAVFINQGK